MPRPVSFFFFFNDTATTEIYTLSLHDALPISAPGEKQRHQGRADENRPVGFQHGQVGDPGARETEQDQDEGAEATGRRKNGGEAASGQGATPALGVRHMVFLPGLRLML